MKIRHNNNNNNSECLSFPFSIVEIFYWASYIDLSYRRDNVICSAQALATSDSLAYFKRPHRTNIVLFQKSYKPEIYFLLLFIYSSLYLRIFFHIYRSVCNLPVRYSKFYFIMGFLQQAFDIFVYCFIPFRLNAQWFVW